MCDCYTTKCKSCGEEISVHIGDFSVSRQHLKVWCPKCKKHALDYISRPMSGPHIVFTDLHNSEDPYIFVVPQPRSIHLNFAPPEERFFVPGPEKPDSKYEKTLFFECGTRSTTEFCYEDLGMEWTESSGLAYPGAEEMAESDDFWEITRHDMRKIVEHNEKLNSGEIIREHISNSS